MTYLMGVKLGESEGQAAQSAPKAALPAVAETLASPVRKRKRAGFVRMSLRHLRAGLWPTLKYLTQTDVHTYAFSVAANAILSFFPFIVLLMTLIRRVFHSQPMLDVVEQLLRNYLPSNQDFIVGNLQRLARAHNGVQVISLVMLLITSTGIFLPLEVALNQVWGFRKNRSYIGNQLISLGLAFGCGALGLISIALTSGSQLLLLAAFGPSMKWTLANAATSKLAWLAMTVVNFTFAKLAWIVMKAFAIVASISIFFFIYWLLPNGKVKARYVFPAAVVAGLLLEVAKYAYILALPILDFREVYGPFSVSVTLMFWAFISGLLLLGGAHLSAAGKAQSGEEEEAKT
ncbi:MAG: YihY/virulence factor BrkB family protein [Terriglobales bacterium]